MRSLSTLTSLLSIWAYIIPINSSGQYLGANPTYDVAIVINGKPIDPIQGIPLTAKTITLKGKLTPASIKKYPQLEQEIAINKAVISLVRDTERVSYVNWTGSESLVNFSKLMQTGDRFVIQFEDVNVQSKDGTHHKLREFKLMQLTVK